jgi:hypothetical protein
MQLTCEILLVYVRVFNIKFGFKVPLMLQTGMSNYIPLMNAEFDKRNIFIRKKNGSPKRTASLISLQSRVSL